MEEDASLEKRWEINIFGFDNNGTETFVKTFRFKEFPNEGEIMFCLLKCREDYKNLYRL